MRVYRRAYVLLIGVAATMGVLAVVMALTLDRSLADPDGFLGPAIVRLPLLLVAAFLGDVIPRAIIVARLRLREWPEVIRARVRDHWTRERIRLVVLGVVCFYVTYVSYRNIKSFLPVVTDTKYDRELHLIDKALFLGSEPAIVLHAILGDTIAAHILSTIYLWFLPLVPLAVTAWLVWSRNISYGYWFATSQCIAWSLGTASYYMLPTLGPGFEYPWLYKDLATTGSTELMEALAYGRVPVQFGSVLGAVQSIAGFASLHCAITLLVALMVQYTIRTRWLHYVAWTNFGITVVATLYFGWHYVADDIAGIVIAMVAFYVGGIASGQVFDKHGLASHPTTSTSKVPIDGA